MSEEKTAPEKKKRHPFRIVWRILKYFSLFLLLLIIAAGSFGYWVCATSGGQNWLLATVNKALAPKDGEQGLSVQLTKLSGVLPFSMSAGLTLADSEGIWLKAPQIDFELDWRRLPGEIDLRLLKVSDADLARLPKLPPAREETPSESFGIAELKSLAREINRLISPKPWWLPDVQIESIAISNFLLPPELIPQKEATARLRLNADLSASFKNDNLDAHLVSGLAHVDSEVIDFGVAALKELSLDTNFAANPAEGGLLAKLGINLDVREPRLNVTGLAPDFLGDNAKLALNLQANASDAGAGIMLSGPDLEAGQLGLRAEANWKSGAAWAQNQLDGPFKLQLNTKVAPETETMGDSPLNIIREPLNFAVAANGEFPTLQLAVNLDCERAQYEKYEVNDLKIAVQSSEIDIPLSEAGLKALANENHIKTRLSAVFEKNPVLLEGMLFFQALSAESLADAKPAVWRAGVRELKLDALGLDCSGELAALALPGKMPLLDGDLALVIKKWDALAAFVPEYKFSGTVSADIALDSGSGLKPSLKLTGLPAIEELERMTQKASLKLDCEKLEARESGKNETYAVGALKLQGQASDIFNDLGLAASLDAKRIQAAGFNLDAKAQVSGPLKGPLQVSLASSGDVIASLAGAWQPGKLNLKTLNLSMNPGRFLADSKKAALVGVNMTAPAEISYGDAGIGISGLDIKILPSGRLRANGGLRPDKLDLSLALENLEFQPWQNLVPQIPSGSAAINLKLSGSPALPAGTFNAKLNRIKIPGAALAPVSLNLDGGLRHGAGGSVFALKMDIDKNTQKALGATTAAVSAQVPLVFAKNGIPELNKNGNLAARIRWDGALGPLWNLVPVADQRLNGRIRIDLDASGTLQKPRLQGGIQMEKGRYENLALGVLLTDMSLKLALTGKGQARKIGDTELPGGMDLTASISDGHQGSVKINGSGNLDGQNLKIAVKIDRLKPLRRRDIHVELSGDVAVAGSVADPAVTGKILINRGEVLLDNLAMTGSVTTLDITQPSSGKKQAAQAPAKPGQGYGSIDLGIRMLPRFRVDGRGLGSVWEANLLVQGSLTNPQITGSINAVSGNFDFLGKIFELTKGTVTFAGGSISNPMLDIQLTNETPDLTAKIMVLGPVNKMRLVITSEPSIPRDEIISRVLFGKSINDLSRLEALQLAAAVAQLAGFGGGGGIMSFTKKALGIDVLRVGTSSSGASGEEDSGAGGTTIEAGKYLTDQLYMGVQQGMKPDSTAFIIQFELTPRTSLEVRTEQNNTWGGLNWKYNY